MFTCTRQWTLTKLAKLEKQDITSVQNGFKEFEAVKMMFYMKKEICFQKRVQNNLLYYVIQSKYRIK